MLAVLLISQNSYAVVGAETVVEAANGSVLIQNMEMGDEFATIKEGSSPANITNISAKITYKSSVKISAPSSVLYVTFGNNQTLIMSLDQAVLTVNGVLVLAKDLTIKDSLVDKNGNPVDISSIRLDYYNSSMHDIITSSKFVTENLYLANGVYVGNYNISSSLMMERSTRAFIGQEL